MSIVVEIIIREKHPRLVITIMCYFIVTNFLLYNNSYNYTVVYNPSQRASPQSSDALSQRD
jgi:hypothetical protein